METFNVDLTIDSRTVREAQRLTGARSRQEALKRAVEAGVHALRYEESLKPRPAVARRIRRELKGPKKRIRNAQDLLKAAGL